MTYVERRRMMELLDIKASVSDMDDEELRELLISIRQSRRTTKANLHKAKKTTTKKRAAKPKPEASFDQLLNGMKADDIKKVLKQLGGA